MASLTIREEPALYIQPFNDRFQNPVALTDTGQVGVEAPGRDQLPRVRGEEGIRLQLSRAFQALLGRLRRHVEQLRRNARVAEMRRNLGSHGPHAENRHRSNNHLS